MQKNTASQKFVVFAFNRTTNVPLTGDAANITANLQKDFGTSTATNDVNPTELEDGFYAFDATQAETNADALVLYPASSTANIQVISVPGVIYTVSTGSPDEVVQTADHTAAIDDVPTVSEFNARTLVAANYFAPATDTVANVTTVGSVTGAVGSVTSQVSANITAISGDSTAADNLELQYDTTGLTGDNFPATQAQVGSISSGSGGLSDVQDSFTNTDGGTETGTEADTETLNAVSHIIDDNAGNTDFYYEFDLGVNGVATSIKWNGFVQSNGDSATAQLYNWNLAVFEDQNSIIGSNGTAVMEEDFPTPLKYTGTGANAGKVRFGFNSADATAVATDRVLCVFTSVAAETDIFDSGVAQAGATNSITLASTASNEDGFYERTRVITTGGTGAGQEGIIISYNGTTKLAIVHIEWVVVPDDTTVYVVNPGSVHTATQNGGYEDAAVWYAGAGGTSGAITFFNATSTKPSSSVADMRTVANDLNIKRIRFLVGSLITLDQSFIGFEFGGQGAFISLNNQDITGSTFTQQGVTGVATSSAGVIVLNECGIIGPCTLPGSNFLECGFLLTFTCGARGNYSFDKCIDSTNLGSTFDMAGDNITPTDLIFSSWNGKATILNATPTDTVKFNGGAGEIIIDASCTGLTLEISGFFTLVDNGSGTGIIGDARYALSRILSDSTAFKGADIAAILAALPTNFAALVITGGGSVDSLVQGYLNTVIAETTAGRLSGNFSTFYDNNDADTTQVVDDVGGGGGGGTDWTAAERNEIRGRLGVTGATAAGGNTPTLSLETSVAAVKADTVTIIAGIVSILVDTLEILSDTNNMQPKLGTPNVTLAADIAAVVTQVLTTQMTESYAAVGVVPTLTQAVMLIQQKLNEISIVDVTQTVKGIDGTTTVATLTQDLAVLPTSVTRTT